MHTHTLTIPTHTDVVVIIQGLGIQSTNWLGYTSSSFIPLTIIGDIITNEGITMVTKHKSTVFPLDNTFKLGTIWEVSLNSEVALFHVLHFRQDVLCRGALTATISSLSPCSVK